MNPSPASRSFRGITDVRLVARQLYFEQLNFWLNPVAAVFTVGFSVVFLVLLASSAGGSRSSVIGNVRVIQYYVPGFVDYGVMSTCFNAMTISLVVRRETGLLKRLRLSPLPTWAMLTALFTNAVIISVLQVVLLLVIGKAGYHVSLPHDYAPFAVALVVGAASFTAVGVAMSTLIPNQEAAGPMVSIVFFVLLFLSGLWYPLDPNSAMAKVAGWFPIRHMITAVFAPFDKRPGAPAWAWHDIAVMALWGAAGVAVALRRWSWSPRRSEGGGRRARSQRAVAGE